MTGTTGPETAIELTDVTKIYRRYGGRHFATLKSALLQRSILRDLRPTETFPALQHVSFKVPKGSTFGVIGRNGSGKSTALKLVAGITKPTSGTVSVHGRISALIELGAGFHPEISGRENVFINGIMLGLTKREIQRRFDEIVEFAEMKEFIDAPVKNYSSGMYMRLGFAVAIHVDPDVLLVDEVLAVGDEGFTHKCLDKFAEFKRRNRTILLVTHSLGLVERFCDEAVWLDAGKKRAEGDPKRVIGAYITDVERQEEQFLASTDAKAAEALRGTAAEHTAEPVDAGDAASNMFQAGEGRWGSGGVEITNVTFQNDQGQATHVFHSGEALTSPPEDSGRAARARFRVRRRHLQRRRRLRVRDEHGHRRARSRRAGRRRRRHARYRRARPRRGHLQARRRRPQAGRRAVRLPSPALHVSREVAAEGRRHLSAEAHVDVLGES